MGMWTCPAAGLWQFTFSIFCQNYTGYPSWNLIDQEVVVHPLLEAYGNGQTLYAAYEKLEQCHQ